MKILQDPLPTPHPAHNDAHDNNVSRLYLSTNQPS